MCDVLVLGYGSDLRGDDAAGRRVAEAIAARQLPGVQARSLPQLTPEVADDLTGCHLAIFIDASTVHAAVHVEELSPVAPDWRLSHSVAPSSLLALAGALGTAPRAVVVSVPARELALGTSLSSATARHVSEAVERIVELCDASPTGTPAPDRLRSTRTAGRVGARRPGGG